MRGKDYRVGDTSGFRGWRPLQQVIGHNDDGTVETIPVFRNIVDDKFHADLDKGHNSEPPYPSGDLSHLRHKGIGTDELWASFRQKAIEDAAREGKSPPVWTMRGE